jgi:hypothetical protein
MDILGLSVGIVVGTFFAGVIFFFFRLSLLHSLESAEQRSMMADLDLATSEQLRKELRNRPNNAYVFLKPINIKDEQGIQIEFNQLSPYNAVSMMHLATTLVLMEMRNKGMETPDLPMYLSED